VVVEKSPSYQFSMLEKYWEVYLYSQGQNQQLSDVFTDRLQNMILYSTHVLQPNGQLPIINATTKKEISYTGIYKEIADTFPEFKYVITKGTSGTKPEALNKVFAEAGQSILRSSWGDKKDFLDQVQVIFEAGPNRSSKNDLNALSFNLYGAGRNLITDSGNYTNTNGLYKNYFHGTLGSNTVVVDNKSQNEGVALLGEFKEGKNYVSQSAFSDLYDGVTHKRTLVLVENKYLIVIDKLESGSEHEYKQVFHLFPGADIKSDDTGVFVNQGDKEIMSVFQLENEGIYFNSKYESNNPIDGICSEEAGVILPCHSLQYSKKTKNATFVTLIQIGKHEGSLFYNFDGESIKIKNSSKNITIDLEEVAGSEEKIVVSGSARPPFNKVPIVGVDALKWNTKDQNEAGGKVQTISDDTGSFLDFRTPDNGKNVSANIPVELDLSTSNLMIRMKVRERPSVNTLQVSFFTNGGKGSMAIDLRNSYREEDNQGWLDISIGKGSFRKTAGRWTEYGEGFDWSDIDKLQITFAAQPGVVAGLQIASISMTPQEKEGEVVIIFDDGYESILPAVEVMNSFGFKGNIAVIADRLETNQRGYLSLKQLQTIKNDYGWDIINHTEHHLSAVSNYANKGKLEEYEQDVLNGAKYLIKNDLNTTPNWMVYPHGATDEKIKSVIKKYYLFARTTINQPESYPFADPYSVKTISADTGESSNSSIVKFIPVADIMSAVVDAKNYKLPLFITFHRINSSSTDRPGYNINEFKKLMSLIAQEKIKVVTLRQFDINHNIPEQKMELVKKVPAELRVKVVITDNSFFSNILNSLISIFRKK
jgi:peptidoglycan/xylan/chitin deacetylase (PgdA/CDA1 family)